MSIKDKLIKDIKELYSKLYNDITIEVNNGLQYISIDSDTLNMDYFFQGECMKNLVDDYKNSCVVNDVTIEEYLCYISQNW